MATIKKILIILVLGCCFLVVQGQADEDPEIQGYMKQAIEEMHQKKFETANLIFRKVLSSGKVVPTDLTFLFAHTLYMLNQFHNSQNFLDKYFRLTGREGKYYGEALDLKRVLDEAVEEILSCSLCDNHGYRLAPCTVCHQTGTHSKACSYCKGIGVARCEVCDGTGVLVTENALSEDHYQTCPNCEGKSQVVCKVCQGAKVEVSECKSCNGTQFQATELVCDHEDEVPSY